MAARAWLRACGLVAAARRAARGASWSTAKVLRRAAASGGGRRPARTSNGVRAHSSWLGPVVGVIALGGGHAVLALGAEAGLRLGAGGVHLDGQGLMCGQHLEP